MNPVTGSSEDGSQGTTCLLVVLGSRKISSELDDRDLARASVGPCHTASSVWLCTAILSCEVTPWVLPGVVPGVTTRLCLMYDLEWVLMVAFSSAWASQGKPPLYKHLPIRRPWIRLLGSANTRSHLGPCNSLRCEMAPWRDWTSLTYMCGHSLWRGTYLWNTVLAGFPVSNMAPVNVNKYLMYF